MPTLSRTAFSLKRQNILGFDKRMLRRVLIIVAAVLLPALIVYVRPPRLLVTAFVALPIGYVALNKTMSDQTVVILALIPINLFVHYQIGTGTGTAINSTLLVLTFLTGAWVLTMAKMPAKRHLHHAPVTKALLLFVATAVLGFITGQIPWFSFAQQASIPAQLGGLSLYLFSALAFLIVANNLRDAESLQKLVYLFFGCGTIYMLSRIFNENQLLRRLITDRSGGSLFWVWISSLLFAQIIWNSDLGKARRWLLALLLGCAFYIMVFSSRFWLSGWIPAMCGILAIILLIRPKIGIILTVLGIGFFIARYQLFAIALESDVENSYSFLTRVEAWKIMLQIWQRNPLTGVGISNYYYYTPLYDILGYNVQFNSHSQYFDFLVQIGVLGTGAFFWLMYTIGRLILSMLPTVKTPFERAYLYGSMGGLVGTVASGFFGDWVVPFVYNVGFPGFRASILGWLFLGGVVAIYRFNDTKSA